MAINGSRPAMDDTPTRITTAPTDNQMGQSVLVKNPVSSGATAYLGDGSVATTTGYPLEPGENVALDLQGGEILYGRVTTPNKGLILNVLETGI